MQKNSILPTPCSTFSPIITVPPLDLVIRLEPSVLDQMLAVRTIIYNTIDI